MAVNWDQIFNSPTAAAAIQSGLGMVGGAMQGKGNEQQAKWLEAQRQAEAARERAHDIQDTERSNANSLFAGRQAQLDDADSNVLGAMGNSPLQFQQERAKMNAVADALKGGIGPSNLNAHMSAAARPGFWTEDKLKMMRPSAAAEQPYWDAVAQSGKGRFNGANLGAIYGDEGAASDTQIGDIGAASGASFEADYAKQQQVLDSLIEEAKASNDADKLAALQQIKAEEAEKPSGGGFWKKLAKIGIIAGAGIATAMTGGAAAPLIGAAAGFGSGAIDGGLKGGLLGAGMGALTGGMGASGGNAAKMGLSQAIKSTMTRPSSLLQMGGAAVGGPAGAAMHAASMIPGIQKPLAGGGTPPPNLGPGRSDLGTAEPFDFGYNGSSASDLPSTQYRTFSGGVPEISAAAGRGNFTMDPNNQPQAIALRKAVAPKRRPPLAVNPGAFVPPGDPFSTSGILQKTGGLF